MIALLVILAAAAVVVLLGAVVAVAVVVPAATQAVERARVEREAQHASWVIHQQATAAFGQMLDEARDTPRDE